jgi:hypothetical protein
MRGGVMNHCDALRVVQAGAIAAARDTPVLRANRAIEARTIVLLNGDEMAWAMEDSFN